MMSGWGIADTAPKIEKIKAESADYLHGLDSCGKIDWPTYSDMFDFYEDLIEKAYAQGKEDAQPEPVTDCHDLMGDLLNRKDVIDAIYKNGCNTRRILDAVEALPSAQPERTKRIIGKSRDGMTMWYQCESCNEPVDEKDLFCSGCGRKFEDG